ncbi:MAG TPA: L,D-transpeptidase family protein [Longimicrobiaceae bacterium]
MRFNPRSALALLALFTGACVGGDSADDAAPAAEGTGASAEVDPSVYGNPRQRLSREELERGRMNAGWRRYVQMDSLSDTTQVNNRETWEEITAQSLQQSPMVLPLTGDVAGPSVARLQIALDRALFSPGIIDGRWGMNTEKAVYWLQKRERLPATGRVDAATWQRIVQLASVQTFTRAHTLTAEDVKGPFITIPEDIYEQAELDCMCYESLSEKLAETFHTSPELLAKLNPGVDLDAVAAGQSLNVPQVREAAAAPAGGIAEIVISDGGHYLHAVDSAGRVLMHFPTTLGSDYAPSPEGEFSITNIAPDPTWHYQPDLLTGVEDWKEEAIIPAGPNNAVGVVWMQLSKPHYGIHGTSSPESIGYVTSHGCVRLTNWDARLLSERIEPGVAVHFRDIT